MSKAQKPQLTPLQQELKDRMRKAGYSWHACYKKKSTGEIELLIAHYRKEIARAAAEEQRRLAVLAAEPVVIPKQPEIPNDSVGDFSHDCGGGHRVIRGTKSLS